MFRITSFPLCQLSPYFSTSKFSRASDEQKQCGIAPSAGSRAASSRDRVPVEESASRCRAMRVWEPSVWPHVGRTGLGALSFTNISSRRQSLSLFRSFRGIGISDHQPCKKSSEENESPGSTQRPYQGTVDAYARPLYGPIWPDPKSQNVAAHPTNGQPCICSAIIIKGHTVATDKINLSPDRPLPFEEKLLLSQGEHF